MQPGSMDLAVNGFPQTKEEAERRGYDWESIREANERQQAVADCRRRAALNRDILDMRLD